MITKWLRLGTNLLGGFKRVWARYGRRGARPYRVERVDDEPERTNRRTLYVIEDTGRAWTAALACPGGCGQVLHMNLLPDSKPIWKLVVHQDGTPTLTPSVWHREGCGSHFFLRRGQIDWCEQRQ